MARYGSVLKGARIGEAKRAHDCRRIKGHRIERGEKRLEVKKGRSWVRYCNVCGAEMLARDQERISSLLEDLRS